MPKDKYSKGGKVIKPSILGTGYAADAAKKIQTRKQKQQAMLDELEGKPKLKK